MPSFPIRDYRGGDSSRTRAMEGEIRRMRDRGLTLPTHPARAAQSIQQMSSDIKDGSALAAVRQSRIDQTRARGMGRLATTGSGVSVAIDKQREPLQSMMNKGIPFDTSDPEELSKIRNWCRSYAATHHLIPLMIDIYSRFPIKGMEIKSKDPQIKEFYEQLFFEELKYEDFLLDFGHEYFTIGEVNSLGNFNEVLGVWDNEELINPEDVLVQKSPFLKEPRYKLRVPELIREIIDTGEPRIDYELIVTQYPEFLQMMHAVEVQEQGMDISNVLLLRTVNKSAPWDVRGTPHMLRCFQTLMGEESLNAAQDAIADRLYSPLIMAKLGSPDLGDGAPWIPDSTELENFKDDMQMALAADFRFMAYHFGIEVENVFGREQMPRLGDDYDRIERKLLQVWGIGEAMISGGGGQAAYASTAVNREVCELLMEGFQKRIQSHFRERAKVVSEAQEFFDYRSSNGVRVPEYEEKLLIDEETGQEYIKKVPKLILPEIEFQTLNLRDEATERAFMQELKNVGVPISDEAMMINVPINFKDEVERVKEEKVQKIVADSQAQEAAVKAIMAQGLPLSPELQLIRQQMQAAEQGYPTQQSSTNLPGAPVPGGGGQGKSLTGLPGSGGNGSGGGKPDAQQNGHDPVSRGSGGQTGSPDQRGNSGQGQQNGSGSGSSIDPLRAADPDSPEGQIQQQEQARMLTEYQDMSSPPLHDIANDKLDMTSPPGTGGGGGRSLPRNRIKQRPEVSDNMRGGSRDTRLASGPSVIDLKDKLYEESVTDAIRERRWEESLPSRRATDE